jgi:hypothetical protein
MEPRPAAARELSDEYLTLAQLAAYSKLSPRQLRNYLALPPGQALPCYRPGRKILVRRGEFDAWLTQFKTRGRPALIRNLQALGFDVERLQTMLVANDAASRL